jgi:hypothetical protein
MDQAEIEMTRSETEFAVNQGKRWRAMKSAELAGLPDGKVVMFNVINGEYVLADDRLEALDKFHQKYGRGVTLGYSFEVGRPTFVGGGIG